MFSIMTDQHWNPYLAGALAGLLAIGSVYATTKVMGKSAYLGTSTTFVRAAGMIERQVLPDRVAANTYFQKESPKVDWQFALVCFIYLGALVGALTGKAFEWDGLPEVWVKRFGRGAFFRGLCAFGGGAAAMFGARLADGCPSGHGLSGMMQLSVSGLAAMACFFLGGAIVARKLYRGGRND
jgi:hypothetical protein